MIRCPIGTCALEFEECKEGITWYRCTVCENREIEFTDCVAGG